jgi:protein-L-isoaspartate(D-aspartate) O-methyltransferase
MPRPPVYPVLLAILALVLAACGGPSVTPPTTTPTAAASSESAIELATPTPWPTPEQLDRDFTDSPEMQAQRNALVDRWVAPRVDDPRVVDALRTVPRHSLIPTYLLDSAYNDAPLPIGYGQTISQPSLVAMMTELLDLQPGDRVLEIGTGSGYQAAILAELDAEVYTVEIIPELAATARVVLDQLGYTDIHIDRHDGYFGWETYAPYDAIIVTAAPDHLPQPLVAQLKDGGRLVIPIGPIGNVQTLWLVTREGDEVSMEQMMGVRFVPFTREGE